MFQCSSASRKFLNFSSNAAAAYGSLVSVLFSEPKIPQCDLPTWYARRRRVSVLFSEPKIPQSGRLHPVNRSTPSFQCSSASRKFLNLTIALDVQAPPYPFQCSSASRKFLNRRCALELVEYCVRFQCSSASRKFLNLQPHERARDLAIVSVLFSEPKIPQSRGLTTRYSFAASFSALQRAENSSMSPQLPPRAAL